MTTQELVSLALALPDMDGVPTQTPYYALLNKLVRFVRPKRVLELGTGTGRSAKAMLRGMQPEAKLLTVNWSNPPSGDNVGCELRDYLGPPVLVQWLGDSRDKVVLGDVAYVLATFMQEKVNFLFIDSDHTYECISEEWRLYSPMLTPNAVVCVDDIDFPGGGVRRWWEEQTYDKVVLPEMSPYGFGIFQFRRDA